MKGSMMHAWPQEFYERFSFSSLKCLWSRRMRLSRSAFSTVRFVDPNLYVDESVVLRYDPRNVAEIRPSGSAGWCIGSPLAMEF
jgi:hypothetical protein